jgi:hypothetical protein
VFVMSSYFVDRRTIGFRYHADYERSTCTGWRPTESWAVRAARRRLRRAVRRDRSEARHRHHP